MASTIEQALAEYREEPGSFERFAAVEAAMTGAGDWYALIRFVDESVAELVDAIEDPWRRLIDALEAIGNRVTAAEERSCLLVATGDVWDERLGRPDQAILVYQAAFKVWPQNPDALARARAVYGREGVWKMVAKLYDLQLKVTVDPAARADLLCDLATVRVQHMDDREAARMAWQAALDTVKDHPRALAALRDLDEVAATGDLESLLAVAEAAEGDAHVRALIAVANHLVDAPDDAHDPASYLHAALSQAPDDVGARRLFRRVLRDSERHEELVDVLATHAADIESPAQRAELHVERAELLVILDQPDDAANALAEALLAVPDHARALARAAEVFGAAERHSDAVAALERSLDFGGTANVRMDRARVAGEIAWWSLGDMDRAAPFFDRVRLIDASNETMLRFFVARWEAQDDVEHLAQAMQDLAAVVDNEQAAELRLRTARLVEDRLDDPIRAADAWAEVVRIQPDLDEAHDAFRRCLFAAGAWNRLVDQLKHDLERAAESPIDTRVRLQLDLANLYANRLDVPALAVKAWTDALALDPEHDETLQSLAAHYADVDRWRDHVEVVLRRVDVVDNEDEQVELLEHVANVCRDQLDDAEGASSALERIIALRPDDKAHRARLGEVHAARHDFGALARLRLDEAADLEGDALVSHLREAARALADADADPEHQRDLLEALVGSTEATDSEAVESLGEVYERLGDVEAHVTLLMRAVDASEQLTPERGMEIAALCEQAGRSDDALSWWRRVLDEHPQHEASRARVLAAAFERQDIDALVELADHTGAYTEVVEALSAIGDDDGDASMAALRAAATIAADHLDVDVERDLRERIGDTDAGDVQNLERRIELAEDLHERAALLEAVIEAAGPVEGSAAIDALVTLCVDQLEQPARAWMHAAARFEAAPTTTHLDAAEVLTDAAEQGDAWLALLVDADPSDAAARRAIDRAIVDRALASNDTLTLVDDATARLLADGETSIEDRDAAHRARIDAATRRRDVDALVAAWDARIASAEGSEHDLQKQRDAARESLLRAIDDTSGLADWLVERAADESGDARIATWLEAAGLRADLADGAGDADEAIALYQAVLGEDAKNDDALEALETLLRASNDASALAGLLERQAAAWDDDRGRDALIALASVQHDALDDPGASADALDRAADRGAEPEALRAGYEALYARDIDDGLRDELWARLETLVRDADDLERLAELLVDRLAFAEDEEQRTLHEELAVLATARDDAEVALAHRRAIVAAGHVDDDAIDALVSAAAVADDWMSALGTLEAAAEAVDGSARARLLDRVAVLQADALDDVDEALALKMQAASESVDADARRERLLAIGAWLDDLDTPPTGATLTSARLAIVDAADADDNALTAALNAARATEEVERLAVTLETVLDRMHSDADAERARALRCQLAELYLDDLDDADEGEAWLRALLAADPMDEDSRARLESLLIDAERWDDLVGVLEERIAGLDGPDALVPLHRLASVQDGARDDADAAAAVWARVVAIDAEDHAARASWREALARAGDHTGLLARLEADRDVDSDGRVALDADRASLLAGPLGRGEDALVLSCALIEEGHGEAIAGVLDLLAADPDPDLANAAREARRDVIAAGGDSVALAQTFITDAEQTEDDNARAELIARAVATLAAESGDRAEQLRFDAARRWLAVRPDEPGAVASLLEACTESSRWAVALDAIVDAEHNTTDDGAQVALLRAAARIRQDELGEADAAADTWRIVLAMVPGDAVAFEALERLFDKAQRYDELALLLVEQGEQSADDTHAVELLGRAARVHEMRTRDLDAAVFALDAAIQRGAGVDLRRERARLLRRQNRWDDLADAMADDARLLTGDEAVAAWVQLGALRHDRLDDLEGAVDAWCEALAIDAVADTALGALGRIVRDASASDDTPGAGPALAARTLLQSDLDASLVEAAWMVLVAAKEAGAHVALARHRVASNAPSTQTAEAWWAALPTALADGDARADCRQWATDHNVLPAWCEATREAALAATEPQVAVDALLELAEVAAVEDVGPDVAIDALQLAHRIMPDDERVQQALESGLAEAGRNDDLADLLEERLAAATEAQREVLLARLVDAALGADDPLRALATIEQTIEAIGPSLALYEQLEAVARECGDADRLTAALRGQVDVAEAPEDRRDARVALASVLQNDHGDLDEAAAVLVAAVDDVPGDVAVLHALVDLHRQRGDAGALVEALDAQADAIGDPAIRAEADAECARLLIDELDSPAEALPRLVAVITNDPTQDEAAARLVELAAHPDLVGLVLADGDPALRAAERWHDVVELWRIVGTDDLAPEGLRDLADVASDRVGDPDQALQWRGRALLDDPSVEEIEPMKALAAAAAAVPRVVDMFGAAASECADDTVAVALLRAAVELERDVLGDADAAAAFVRRIVERDPADVEAVRSLADHYEDSGAWDDLIAVLERLVDAAAASETGAVRIRMATILAGPADRPFEALEMYQDAFADDTVRTDAIEGAIRLLADDRVADEAADALEPILRARGRHELLAEVLALRLERADASEVAPIADELADLYEGQLQDHDLALTYAMVALAADPIDPRRIARMSGLAAADPSRQMRALSALADAVDALDDLDLRLLARRLAVDLATTLNDFEAVDAQQRGIVADDLHDSVAWVAVRSRLSASGQAEEEYAWITARAESLADPVEAAALWRAAADLASGPLGEPSRAIAALEAAVDIQPTVDLFEELEMLERQQGDIDAAAAWIERRADHPGADASIRGSALRDLARMLTVESEDNDRIIGAWERVRAEADDGSAADVLRGLYAETERWDDLLALLQQELEAADADDTAALRHRIADIAIEQLDDPGLAMAEWRRLLDDEPSDERAWQGLGAALADGAEWYEYVTRGLSHAASLPDEARAALAMDLAERALTELEDPSLAETALQCLDTHHGRVDVLRARVRRARGDLEGARAALESALGELTDPASRADAFVALAVLAADGVGDPESETSCLEAALAEVPDHRLAIERLDAAYTASRNAWGLTSLIDRRLAGAGDDEIVDLLLHRADIAMDWMDDADEAADTLMRAWKHDPSRLDVGVKLVDACLSAERTADVPRILDEAIRIAEETTARDVLPIVYEQRARLAEARGDSRAALGDYERVFAIDARRVSSNVARGRLLHDEGDLEGALKALQAAYQNHSLVKDTELKRALFYEFGRLRESRGELDRAKDMYRRARSADRAFTGSQEALDRLK